MFKKLLIIAALLGIFTTQALAVNVSGLPTGARVTKGTDSMQIDFTNVQISRTTRYISFTITDGLAYAIDFNMPSVSSGSITTAAITYKQAVGGASCAAAATLTTGTPITVPKSNTIYVQIYSQRDTTVNVTGNFTVRKKVG